MNEIEKAIEHFSSYVAGHGYQALIALREKAERENKKCADCKFFWCCSAIDRQFYCKHQSGLKHIEAIEQDTYCSYFEPKAALKGEKL